MFQIYPQSSGLQVYPLKDESQRLYNYNGVTLCKDYGKNSRSGTHLLVTMTGLSALNISANVGGCALEVQQVA